MVPELNANYSISSKQIDQFWNEGFIYLKEVLNQDEIKIYGDIIRKTANKRINDNKLEPVSEGAFYQTLNLRFDSPEMMKFTKKPTFQPKTCFGPKMPKIPMKIALPGRLSQLRAEMYAFSHFSRISPNLHNLR